MCPSSLFFLLVLLLFSSLRVRVKFQAQAHIATSCCFVCYGSSLESPFRALPADNPMLAFFLVFSLPSSTPTQRSHEVLHPPPPFSFFLILTITHSLVHQKDLTNALQLHRKVKRRIRRDNPASPSRAIPKPRRNNHIPLLPNLHLKQGLIPPSNDLPDPRTEGQRLPTVIGGVELLGGLEVVQPARVVDIDGLPCSRWRGEEEGGVRRRAGGRRKEGRIFCFLRGVPKSSLFPFPDRPTCRRDGARAFLDNLGLEAGL